MTITVDTNILVRAVVYDDPQQSTAADQLLSSADLVCIGHTALCEMAWVLRSSYGFKGHEVAAAIRALIGSANVEVDKPVVELGLAMLDAGGDFADGVIAYEGEALGAETFVSFDSKAAKVLAAQGVRTQLL